MGSLMDVLGSICDDSRLPYEIVDHPSDFAREPVRIISRDYTPVQVMRMGWCNERGTGGRSRKAVIHAKCDRAIGKRQKGDLLCGYKSKAKYGGDLFSVDADVNCPKCQQLALGLERSMRVDMAYGWFP